MVTFAVDPLVDGMVASVRMKMGVIGVGEGLGPGKGRGQVNAVMVKARGKGDHRVLPILRRVLQRNCQKRGEINEMRNAADKKKYVLRTAAGTHASALQFLRCMMKLWQGVRDALLCMLIRALYCVC